MKRITRSCVVCGKKIRVAIYEKGHYKGGHYFGKMKIPVEGTGEYKKTGTYRLGKRRCDVVKWTGKEKQVEYWECEDCYSEAMKEDWLEDTIRRLYGKRCRDFEKGCCCCQAWSIFDTIIEDNRGRL